MSLQNKVKFWVVKFYDCIFLPDLHILHATKRWGEPEHVVVSSGAFLHIVSFTLSRSHISLFVRSVYNYRQYVECLNVL